MNQNELNARLIKAAAMGANQSLANRGFNDQLREAAVSHYVAPNGLLAKRASDRFEAIRRIAYNAIVKG